MDENVGAVHKVDEPPSWRNAMWMGVVLGIATSVAVSVGISLVFGDDRPEGLAAAAVFVAPMLVILAVIFGNWYRMNRRLIASLVESGATLAPTTRKPPRAVRDAAKRLERAGFQPVALRVMVNDGDVISYPIPSFFRPSDDVLAVVDHRGRPELISALDDGRTLVTTSGSALPNERFIVQRVSRAAVSKLDEVHQNGLRILESRGVAKIKVSDPEALADAVFTEMMEDGIDHYASGGGIRESLTAGDPPLVA